MDRNKRLRRWVATSEQLQTLVHSWLQIARDVARLVGLLVMVAGPVVAMVANLWGW